MFFRSPPWDSVVYWSLDLETGGLDAAADPVLAVGMVPVRAGRIRLREAYRTLVRPDAASHIDPDSVHAHQLVSSDLQAAPPIEEVLPEIDRRIREGALLVHHGAIDVTFLRREFKRAGLTWPKPPVVDTVRLLVAKARFASPELAHDQMALNLSLARAQHGLPDYQAHDALTDAIATAELFLALRIALGARTLRDLRRW
jgi:DNA polymerase-3 subunit epsilon